MERADVIKVVGRVAVAGTALVVTEGAEQEAVNNRIPIVYSMPDSQRTPDDCVIRVGVSAQEFEEIGGPTFADGRPRFQPNIDRIIGPVAGRDYLVKAPTSKEISALLTTNPQGEGIDPRTGRNYAEFTGKGEVIDGRPKMTITNKSQDSGDEIKTAVTCGNKFTDQRYIHRGRAELKTGQGTTVLPKGTEIITTPAATSEPRRVETPPAAVPTKAEQPSPVRSPEAQAPQPPAPRQDQKSEPTGFEKAYKELTAALFTIIILAVPRSRLTVGRTVAWPFRYIRHRRSIAAGGPAVPHPWP